MGGDPVDDLLVTCVRYIGAQRRLLEAQHNPDAAPAAVETAMTAELDQLATAVRHAQRHLIPRHRGDPGS